MGGNTKDSRRRFGAVRRLPSGQWQARYLGPDSIMRPLTEHSPRRRRRNGGSLASEPRSSTVTGSILRRAGWPSVCTRLAKAYRLLRAVMNTAADDGLIRRNPCRLKVPGRRDHLSGQCSPSARCLPWLGRSTGGTAPRSCSRFSAACVGPNWPRSAAATSTWRHVPCESFGN
jgi:hypothetical protein